MKNFTFAIIIALLVLVLVEIITTVERESFEAVVVQRNYSPATTSSGTTIDSKGNVGIVSTSTPEKWDVVVKLPDGRVVVATAKAAAWAECEPHATVIVKHHRSAIGLFSVYRIQ